MARALPCQGRGRQFESGLPLKKIRLNVALFFVSFTVNQTTFEPMADMVSQGVGRRGILNAYYITMTTKIQQDPVFDELCEKIARGEASKEEIQEAFGLLNTDIDSFEETVQGLKSTT